MDDAHKRHEVAFARIEEELTEGLICGSEMVVRVGKNILCELVVIALNRDRKLE